MYRRPPKSSTSTTFADFLPRGRIYFGNWLRDYSQAVDVGTVKYVSSEAIRIVLWVLAFMSFGYGTGEFEVVRYPTPRENTTPFVDEPVLTRSNSRPGTDWDAIDQRSTSTIQRTTLITWMHAIMTVAFVDPSMSVGS